MRTIVANTFNSDTDFIIGISDFNLEESLFASLKYQLKNIYDTKDVLVWHCKDNFDANISSNDLTKLSLALSESSFSELWDNEDDEYWNSY